MKTNENITSEYILSEWRRGNTRIDWRTFTIKGKREWLIACLLWSGLPKQLITSFDYVIDAHEVSIDIDFYCLLGEVFFGHKGYFGQDLDGFNDCFSEIFKFEKTTEIVNKGAKVIIKNPSHLKDVLTVDIFSELLRIFERRGFLVELV
jgi:hypothetical protein